MKPFVHFWGKCCAEGLMNRKIFMKKTISILTVCWMASLPAYGQDLLEAYELGIRNDPLVLEAESKRNAALKNKPIALAELLPLVTLNGDMTGYQTTTGQSYIRQQANTEQRYWQGNFNLRLTQPLFHYDSWVKYWQADHQIAQAQAELETEYQNLAVRTAKAYFDILAAEENVEFTSIELHSLELQSVQVKERLAAGFATVMDLDEVRAQYDKVAADLILAEQQLNDAKESLREIIGNIDVALTKLPDELPLLKPEPADVEAWRAMAQQSNLKIITASSAAAVAKENIDLNFAGHLPSVDIVGTKVLSDTNRISGVNYDQNSIGLYVTVPIYAGGGTNARVEQARDSYEQALHEVDKQRRAAERQVKDGFRGVLSAISRVGALATALKSAQSALDAAQMGYHLGDRTIVDVLIEQSKYFGIRRDYAKSRYDYLVNGLLLKQAAGTLAKPDIEALNSLIHNNARGGGMKPVAAPKAVPEPDQSAAPLTEERIATTSDPQIRSRVSPGSRGTGLPPVPYQSEPNRTP
jgi:outer membrane protein